MPAAIVQSTANNTVGSSGPSLQFAAGPAGGNAIVAAFRWNSTTVTLDSVDESTGPGNVYSNLFGPFRADGFSLQAFGSTSITSGVAIAVRGHFSGVITAAMKLVEISGQNTTTFLDNATGATGNTTNPTISMLSPNANDLVLGWFGSSAGSTYGSATGFNLVGTTAGRPVMVSQSFTTSGTHVPEVNMLNQVADRWGGIALAIMDSAGGGTTTVPISAALTGQG